MDYKYQKYIVGICLLLIYINFLSVEANTIEDEKQRKIKFSLVQMNLSDKFNSDSLLKYGFSIEHSIIKDGFYAQLIIDNRELDFLKAKDIEYQILYDDYEKYYSDRYQNYISKEIHDLPLAGDDFSLGSWAGYFNLKEIYMEFDNFLKNNNKFAHSKEIIGKTCQNREIYAWCFGDTTGNSPEVLITALHHAREPGSASTVIFFLRNLMRRAMENDEEVLYLLKHRKLYVIPVINPDGYEFNYKNRPEGGGLWRKNMDSLNDSTFGVDINRNYGPYEFWNAPNFGSAIDAWMDTYRGSLPFSETGTQAIKNFCEKHNFKIALNYHTHSNLIIYPFSATVSETPDSSNYRDLSLYLTKFTRFLTGRDIQTVKYNSRGSSDDWMYLAEPKKPKILSMTVEIGTDADGFWALPNRIVQHGKENLFMNYQILWGGGANIRPVSLELKKDTAAYLELKVENLGTEGFSGLVNIGIKSLDSGFSWGTTINLHNPGSFEKWFYDFKLPKTQNSFLNGKIIKFEISTSYDGLTRLDTFTVSLFDFKYIDLYSSGKLTGNWKLQDWGYQWDSALSEFVLADSPNGYYKDSSSNYLTMTEPITLTGNAASLIMDTKWFLEPGFDYGIIQVSSDDGKTWNFLTTSRMPFGSGIPNARITPAQTGFNGTYPDWLEQECTLNDYLNKPILFRFAVLADGGKNLDGWFIRNLRIKLYEDIRADITEYKEIQSVPKLIISPEPVIAGTQIKISITGIETIPGDNYFLKIFDTLGNEIFSEELNGSLNYFNMPEINSGIYFVRVVTTKYITSQKIIVLGTY